MEKNIFDKKFALAAGDSVVVESKHRDGSKTNHLHYDHTGPATTARIRVDLDDAEDLAKSDEHPMKAGIVQDDQPDLHRHPIHDAIETETGGEQ